MIGRFPLQHHRVLSHILQQHRVLSRLDPVEGDVERVGVLVDHGELGAHGFLGQSVHRLLHLHAVYGNLLCLLLQNFAVPVHR